MIQLTPMPRKTSDITARETYTVALPNGAGHARVELYFDKSDSTKTIYGVNIITLITTADNASFGQIDSGRKSGLDGRNRIGREALNGTDGTATISGLTRGQDGTVSM